MYFAQFLGGYKVDTCLLVTFFPPQQFLCLFLTVLAPAEYSSPECITLSG